MFRNYNAFKGHTMIFVAIKNDNCHCLNTNQIKNNAKRLIQGKYNNLWFYNIPNRIAKKPPIKNETKQTQE